MKNLVFVFVLILFGCTNEEEPQSAGQDSSVFCNITRKFDEKIDSRKGRLIFDKLENKYAIYYYHPGTVDGQTQYILCEKPENIKLEENILFSGESYFFNENFDPPLGGMQYRFLELTDIGKDKSS